jgi:hypothetical protein
MNTVEKGKKRRITSISGLRGKWGNGGHLSGSSCILGNNEPNILLFLTLELQSC